MKESPLYTRTYDMLLWLIPTAQKFPRQHRFTLAERIQHTALDFQAKLVETGKVRGNYKRQRLQEADILLAQLRVYVRLAKDLHCLDLRQYEHAARLLTDVGHLLGAWLQQLEGTGQRPRAAGRVVEQQ